MLAQPPLRGPSLRRTIAALCLVSFAASGCFGTFTATRKLWEFNKEVSENKFVQWLVFLAFAILPVYALFSLGDALVFNSLEFWTDSNPIAGTGAAGAERLVQVSREEAIRLRRDGASGEMTVEVLDTRDPTAPQVVSSRRFTPIQDGMVVYDGDGVELLRLRRSPSGELELLGPDGAPFAFALPGAFDHLTRTYERGGARALAQAVRSGAGLASLAAR